MIRAVAILLSLLSYGLCFSLPSKTTRYNICGDRAAISIDSAAPSLIIDVATLTADRSRIARNNQVAWSLKYVGNDSYARFIRISEPRYDVGQTYTVSIGKTVGDVDIIIDSITVDEPYARYPAAQFFTLIWSDNTLTIASGSSHTKTIASVTGLDIPTGQCTFYGNGINFDTIVVETTGTPDELMTRIDENYILNQSQLYGDPLIGIWSYLDRETDETIARLGGRYKLGIARDTQSADYLIVYLEGATVNPSLWQPGMIKGRLTPTSFDGQYNLIWYDALGDIVDIDVDAYAVIEGNSLLTLAFPLYSTSMRLSK